jgi:hypothetical protein
LNDLFVLRHDSSPAIDKPSATLRQLRWDHADLLQYYHVTYQGLFPVFERLNNFCSLHGMLLDDNAYSIDPAIRCLVVKEIDECYSQIVSVLHSACLQCIPSVPKNFFKYWWDQELQTLKEQSIAAHKDWVSHGRPRQGQFFDNNKSAKYKYKSRIKQQKHGDNNSISNSLHDALLRKDQSSFWNVWKSKFS